ncbi:MAG: AAA family ATPase [Dehalococcoidia bacterium]
MTAIEQADSFTELRPARDIFVGRRRELATLHRMLEDVAGQASLALFVEGEPGIGKTSLIEEALRGVQAHGLRVLRARCYSLQEPVPYAPFIDLLKELGPEADPLREFLARAAAQTAREPWAVPGQDAVSRRHRLILDFARAVNVATSGVSSILWIDDVQWADRGTLLVLTVLLTSRHSNLSVICSGRSYGEAPEDTVLLGEIRSKCGRLTLRGLNEKDALEYATALTGWGHLSHREVRALRSFTGGNPLLLQELVLHVMESGLLQRHGAIEAVLRAEVPVRLGDLVLRRVRELPAETQKLLSAAAILGCEFVLEDLSVILDSDEAAVYECLRPAFQRQIVERVDAIGAVRGRFAHPLIQAILYETLPAAERRRIHTQVAADSPGLSRTMQPEELARHYAYGLGRTAGRGAISCCRRAAERAESLLAFESSERFWELALLCCPPTLRAERAELLKRLGWATWAASKWERASEAWAQAFAEFERLGVTSQLAELALALGELHRWRLELDESERWLTRALDILPESSPLSGRTRALLASVYCAHGDTDRGLRLLAGTEEIAQDDPNIEYWRSYVHLTAGNPDKAFEIASRALDVAKRQGSLQAVALLAGTLFHHHLAELNRSRARELAKLVHQSTVPSDTSGLIYGIVCDTLLHGYFGEWARAAKACQRAIDRTRLAGSYQAATARFLLGEALVGCGRPRDGVACMREALPRLERMRPVAAMHLAAALIETGEQGEALDLVKQFSSVLLVSRRSPAGKAALGDVVASLDVPDLHVQCYNALADELRPIVLVYRPISVQRVLGRLAGRLGQWNAAIRHFEDAISRLEAGRARWELWRSYIDYAAMRRARRRRGDERKAIALELKAYEVLGIVAERAPAVKEAVNIFALTSREIDVLSLVALGRRNAEIAGALTISPRTVARHLQNIFTKMDADSRTAAVMKATAVGIVGPLRAGSNATAGAPGWRKQAGGTSGEQREGGLGARPFGRPDGAPTTAPTAGGSRGAPTTADG